MASRTPRTDYQRTQYNTRLMRMNIISGLLSRGYSDRELRKEVQNRLDLKTYALSTLQDDKRRVLDEMIEETRANTEQYRALELKRIDELIKEAWDAWEKSKESYEKVRSKQSGIPGVDEDGNAEGLITTKAEQTRENVNSCGDPRYLEVIHKLLQERRKLLGLYSPDKVDHSGSLTFEQLLMQTGIIED